MTQNKETIASQDNSALALRANKGLADKLGQIFVPLFKSQRKTHATSSKVLKEAETSKIDPSTGLLTERHLENGRLHRDLDLPALIESDPNTNRVVREQYYRHGKLHRDDGKPAYVEYSPVSGHVVLEVFFRYGKLHQEGNRPSAINYDSKTGERILYDVTRPGSAPVQGKS
jgi:hypothetical protein